VPAETAITLGSLRRRGYAVSVVLVMFEDEDYSSSMGRLIAEGLDVRRVDNEAAVMGVCSAQLVR